MKKLLSKFSLFITFFIIFGISYIIKLTSMINQGTAFIYLLGILIFCMAVKIFLGVLINDYETSKLLDILAMIVIYSIILFTSWLAAKILDVNLQNAFQLITFGVALKIKKENIIIEKE